MVFAILLNEQYTVFQTNPSTSVQANLAVEYEKDMFSKITKTDIPQLWKHPNVKGLDCAAMFKGDTDHIKENSVKRRTLGQLPYYFPMSCEDIRSRGFYPKEPLSKIEADFPFAYIRNVYRDYLSIELSFLISYAPQNYYCFSIDKKSDAGFQSRMFALANCFPNVFLITGEFEVNSAGKNTNLAAYKCMQKLDGKNYKYLFTLQNDDISLKTNRELVEIISLYNGGVDIQFEDPTKYIKERVNMSYNWNHSNFNFFNKNHSKSEFVLFDNSIVFQKVSTGMTLPKSTVDYILHAINITKFLDAVNTDEYGVDEMAWGTLLTDSTLNIPGMIDRSYVKNNYKLLRNNFMTRYTEWVSEDSECVTGIVRHTVCIYGCEHLQSMKTWPHFFGNKFKASSDFGALTCWSEYIYNKMYLQNYNGINKTFYEDLAIVKYNNRNRHTSRSKGKLDNYIN
uniref:Core-2/I-Branching enzyme n=1 Tax=Rhabditophanes sp. KR3021 TaxID=114890 RepID=A0AC35TZS9_9BILA